MSKDPTSHDRALLAALGRGVGLSLLTLVVVLLAAAGSAHAASMTWDGGCGADTTWSCAGNWSGDAVPAAGDTAVFSGVSAHDSTVDPGFAGTVGTIQVNRAYAGTISLARSLELSKNFTQRGGSFDAGGQALTLGALTLSGGAFTASSGITSVAAGFNVTGTATFDANGGTVDLDGGGGTVACAGVAFHRVTISHATGVKTVAAGCDLPLGNNPDAGSGGSIKLNGTLSGSGTLTTSRILTLGTTGSLAGFSGLAAETLTVSGSYDFGAYSTFSVTNAFTLASGANFVAPSTTASFAGNFKISDGAGFVANGGTVSFDGTLRSTLSCGNKVFAHVTFAHTAGGKVVGADCSLPLGNNPTLGMASNASVTLNGSLSGTGTLTAREMLTMDSTSSLSGFDGLVTEGGLTMSHASSNFGSYGTFAIGDKYAQTGGAVAVPAGADFGGIFTLKSDSTFDAATTGPITFAGDFVVGSAATFDAHGSTVRFDGDESATIACGNASFDLVGFSNTAGTKTVAGSCSLPLGNDPSAGSGGSIMLNGAMSGSGVLTTTGTLTLAAGSHLSGFSGLSAAAMTVNGTQNFGSYAKFSVGGAFTLNAGSYFTAPAGAATFGGDFIAESGSGFAANGGTVELVGTGQEISGSTTFYNLSKKAGSADTLRFGAGSTQTVQRALTLKGKGAGGLLTLASSSPGIPWVIDRGGAAEAVFVSVSDSTNLGTSVVATESVSGGGNSGWSISGAATQFVVAAGSTTPKAGEADNLTITAKDAYGNTAASYTGSHDLTFGPVADSPSGAHATVTNGSGTATNFGSTTAITFTEGIAAVSGGKNGAMTMVKAGSTSLTVSDGSIANGSGLAVTVSPGTASSLSLAASTTTPKAGEADNLTITAKDAYGNTAISYNGSHNLTFGPVSDSPSGSHATVSSSTGTATNFGTSTAIAFSEGVATVSSGKNGAMTLVKAGSTSLTVSDGSIANGSGLAVTVSAGSASRLAWTNATVTKGKLSSPCLFTCAGTELTSSGSFKANVSVTDSSGNTVSALGSGHTVSVTTTTGTIAGGSLTIAGSGPAESTAQFTFTPPSKGSASTVTAATAGGTAYTSVTATMER
jgi:hypothetical protein